MTLFSRFTLGVTAALALSAQAAAAPVTWTDWTDADGTSATGTAGGVTVTFNGDLDPSAQTNGGTNYWSVNSGIFTAPGFDNAPPDSDIIRLNDGSGAQTLTFSTPVTDPLMAIMSLGRRNLEVRYDFDAPFTILNQGEGFWGGDANALSNPSGNVLSGFEGHGLIQFDGTFSTLSWTIQDPEFWHGFQIGYAESQQVPVPASLLFLGLGLAAAGGFGLRRALRG